MCSSTPKAINVSNGQLPAATSVAAKDHHDDGGEEKDGGDNAELKLRIFSSTFILFIHFNPIYPLSSRGVCCLILKPKVGLGWDWNGLDWTCEP